MKVEALHPRQMENPCPTMKGEPPQDAKPADVAPQTSHSCCLGLGWPGGPVGSQSPPAPLGAVLSQQQGCHSSLQRGWLALVSHPPVVTQAAPGGRAAGRELF